MFKINRDLMLGILLCVFSAIISIEISKTLGSKIFELEKSPISPIIISIIIGIIISNLVYPKISNFKIGFDYCIKIFCTVIYNA